MTLLDGALTLDAAVTVRLVVVMATLLAWRSGAWARRIAFGGSIVASLASAGAAALVLAGHGIAPGLVLAHAPSGLSMSYGVDPLSAWFLLVLAAVSVPVAIFSLGYVSHGALAARSTWLGVAFNVLLGAVELVVTATDALAFLAAWEVMTLSTAGLVATEHEHRESRNAAFLYLAMSHVGTGCLIAAFLTLATLTGGTSLAGAAAVTGPIRHVLFALFLVGFGVKAGAIPFHVWLPEAHPAAPSNISALMSGVIIKTGIYGLVRMCAFGLGVPDLAWGVVILALGAVSAVLGVLYALMQHDLKRLLAYHSIENIGIILLGLGAGMIGMAYGRFDVAAVGVAAALYHTLNHGVFKALLFLGAGNVVLATGTRNIERYGGLIHRMPWTAATFLVGAAAISGLPPFNGFVSEWLTLQTFLFGFRSSSAPLVHLVFTLGGALLALTAALAAACFVKAFGITFLARSRGDAAANAVEAGGSGLVPLVILAFLCVALGVLPGAVLGTLETVTASLPGLGSPAARAIDAMSVASGMDMFDQLRPGVFLVVLGFGAGIAALLASFRRAPRRSPAWGCGGTLDADAEYTATAFSKPLMMIFAAIYRPTRKVETLGDTAPYFPRGVRYEAEIEPTFERHLYAPLVRTFLSVAEGMRRLQAGSLHAYLGYVIALVVVLVLYVWWNG